MNRKSVLLLIVAIFSIAVLGGCSANNATSGTSDGYYTISSQEAKDMMEKNSDLLILDVRTPEEFAEGHIQGAVNIPDTDIKAVAENAIPDKEAVILVYCRSGRRSALASKDLESMGYTGVYDFGGIIDWEYDIVTE